MGSIANGSKRVKLLIVSLLESSMDGMDRGQVNVRRGYACIV
jgi:hypothetical protein